MPRPCVLIVDDSEPQRAITREALESLDSRSEFEIEEASDGTEALTIVERLVVDERALLLLTDNRMPGMSGLELVQATKRSHPRAPIACAILAGAEPPATERAAISALGADLHVRPFSLAETFRETRSIVAGWLAGVR